jgi:Phosphotransferase enzyme family
MIQEWTDPYDRLLAGAIFGTDRATEVDGMIRDWAQTRGFGHGQIDSVELSVGAGVTLQLATEKLFVKVWPGDADSKALSAQLQVQGRLAANGFPAPRVLTELSRLGPGWAIAMAYSRGGVATDVRVPGVRRMMAAGLSHFLRASESCRDVPHLPHRMPSVWPRPHNVLFDFEATATGAEWIDDMAHSALATMRSTTSRIVVGHLDWSAKNMRMGPDDIAVVYDWDAVFLEHETFVVGAAAAHFPTTWELDVSGTPDAREVTAFIKEYEEARGQGFTEAELEEVAASVTYTRAYTARCEHAGDPGGAGWNGSSRQSLKDNGAFRFS